MADPATIKKGCTSREGRVTPAFQPQESTMDPVYSHPSNLFVKNLIRPHASAQRADRMVESNRDGSFFLNEQPLSAKMVRRKTAGRLSFRIADAVRFIEKSKPERVSAMPTIPLTDADFAKAVLESEGISVVDFWSPTCGTCHAMDPALEAFASANAVKTQVYKVDVNDNPKTADKYQIQSVPTVIFFKNGEPAEVIRGSLSQASLQSRLDALSGS